MYSFSRGTEFTSLVAPLRERKIKLTFKSGIHKAGYAEVLHVLLLLLFKALLPDLYCCCCCL
jgi:hypothetical protein